MDTISLICRSLVVSSCNFWEENVLIQYSFFVKCTFLLLHIVSIHRKLVVQSINNFISGLTNVKLNLLKLSIRERQYCPSKKRKKPTIINEEPKFKLSKNSTTNNNSKYEGLIIDKFVNGSPFQSQEIRISSRQHHHLLV